VEITPTDECDNTHRFTGHERDTETGNDYMHFRFFSSNMGRFQKPDSNFDSPLSNPQGWNLYSYVKGNPVNFNDPTGHIGQDILRDKAMIDAQKVEDPADYFEKMEEQAKFTAKHMRPNVTLHVDDRSGALKDEGQRKQFEGEIKRIYGDAGINVEITYDSTSKLDNWNKQLVITSSNSLPDQRKGMPSPKDAIGVTPDCGNIMYVDTKRAMNRIGSEHEEYLGTALGRAGAHELGHSLTWQGDGSTQFGKNGGAGTLMETPKEAAAFWMPRRADEWKINQQEKDSMLFHLTDFNN
jgi:RHS repeat-associated protein